MTGARYELSPGLGNPAVVAVVIGGISWLARAGLAVTLLSQLRGMWEEKNKPDTNAAKVTLGVNDTINAALAARARGEITSEDFKTIMAAVGQHFPDSKEKSDPSAWFAFLNTNGSTIAAAVVSGLAVAWLAKRIL